MKLKSIILITFIFALISQPKPYVIDSVGVSLPGKIRIIKQLPETTFTPVTEAAYAVPAEPGPGCGDNAAANFIYTHESGCQLNDPNPLSGACGLGQAWPCSKLMAVCPSMDYACENQFFNQYAVSAYGSWAIAYNFWVSHQWW